MAQATLSADRPQTIDAALARSVLYGVITRAFQPPTAAAVEALTSNEGQRTFRDAVHLLDVERSEVPRLSPAVEALVQAADQTRLGDLIADYSALFGHTARGLVCPYETEYGPTATFAQPQTLADIAGSYRAFGLRRSPEADERVDHIGCECEFVMFLALKEAYALEALGDESAAQPAAYRETLEETRKASRLFLRDHLGRFGRAFANTVVREDPHRFYGSVARLLEQLLDFDCARLEVPVGPPTLELRSDEEDETPMGCGDGEQLIQIQRGKP